MSRYLLFAVIALGLGLSIWEIASRSSRAYERMLVERVRNGLDVLGYDWVEVKADGLKLELHGHAPDTFARELALESARATAPIATITSYATATLAPPEHRDPVRVELLRDSGGITMTGQTASRAMRDRLNATLAGRDPKLEVHDLTGIQAAQPPRGWGAEVDVATLAATALGNALVVMEPGRVLVDGQAANADERARLTAALRQIGGDQVALSLRIRIPAAVIAPFTFAAEKDPGRAIRIESCAVRTEEEERALRPILMPAGPGGEMTICQVGLGGPGGDWPSAIAAGMAALGRLPAGRVEIEYRNARLTGAPPTSPAEFDEIARSFGAALPEGYQAETALAADDVATRTGIARELYWMTFARSPLGVTISGQVPDEATATAVTSYAIALFGVDRVAQEMQVVDSAPPRQWQIAALAMLDELALASGGEARMAGYRISLRASISDPALAHRIHQELARGLPSYDVSTVFEVDLPAQLAAIPMPAPRCAERLNRVHARGSIDFSTGSARITQESAAVLDELAAVFSRCTDERIEVEGHTDSQGAEDLNQRISQARAEAVVAALVKRGVADGRLVARGYGETVPIADNQTEEGRARNRRIEFAAAASGGEDEAVESGETAVEAEDESPAATSGDAPGDTPGDAPSDTSDDTPDSTTDED